MMGHFLPLSIINMTYTSSQGDHMTCRVLQRHEATKAYLSVFVLPHRRHSAVTRHFECRRGSKIRGAVKVGMSHRRIRIAPLWRLQHWAQASARRRGPGGRAPLLQGSAGGQVLVKELRRERTSKAHALFLGLELRIGGGGILPCRDGDISRDKHFVTTESGAASILKLVQSEECSSAAQTEGD